MSKKGVLLALTALAGLAAVLPRLAGLSNTQVHRINRP
jgi:hypothetical protein